jgi:hypothetical protein
LVLQYARTIGKVAAGQDPDRGGKPHATPSTLKREF